MKYPRQAQELVELLKSDQSEWREFARKEFETQDKASLKIEKTHLRQKVHTRTLEMLAILAEIQKPTLSNIGGEAAQAISILALHDSVSSLRKVLHSFNDCFDQERAETYYQAIPSMTDWLCILEHKPQQFGTIWLFDRNKYPFLPTVEDFGSVNDRRTNYGIEPLHWPKSLAIAEEQQPWLKRPLSELVMREPTAEEYEEFASDYLN